MFTRRQWRTIILQVVPPYIIMAVLGLLSNGFYTPLFEPIGNVYGMTILLGLSATNLVVLALGYTIINNTLQPDTRTRRLATSTLVVLSFVLFALPALWMATLGPAAVELIRSGTLQS